MRVAYALEPVEALDAAAVDRVRQIYEEGFPPRLRADFSAASEQRQASELALALVSGGQPSGFAMLRPLGDTGWVFLRYFVVAQPQRGHDLCGILWDQLTAQLGAAGYALPVFDVEDPAEPGCGQAESQVRSRRISFYHRHGARLLPVHGYHTPHGAEQDPGIPRTAWRWAWTWASAPASATTGCGPAR